MESDDCILIRSVSVERRFEEGRCGTNKILVDDEWMLAVRMVGMSDFS